MTYYNSKLMLKSIEISHINVGEMMKKIIFGKNKNIIGKNLKSIRKEKNLSQDDLAAKMQTFNLNMDQQMISKIENNSRIVTDYELAYFCKILGVDVNELLLKFDDTSDK